MSKSEVRTVHISGDGQLSISQAARRLLHLRPGSSLLELVIGNCLILVPQDEDLNQTRQSAHQALCRAGVTVEELEAEIDRIKAARLKRSAAASDDT